MKQSIWQRVLAFIIVLTMCFELLPMTTFAVEDTSVSSSDTLPATGTASIELSVISEVQELRDATSKHFRLSDGSYAAVEYGIPVHYQVEGTAWEEIDNTLTYADDSGMFFSENGVEARGYTDTLYLNQPAFVSQYGGYEVEISLLQQSDATDENSVDSEENGNVDELTSEMTLQSDEPYSINVNSTEDGIFEATDNSDLNEDTDSLMSEYESQDLGGDMIPVGVPAIIINPGEGAALYSATQTNSNLSDQFLPEKLGSTVIYEDVIDGVDLMYENYSYSVKETILVKEPQDSYSYSFRLSVDNLIPELEEDGSVILYDVEGNPVYIIPAPYMYDAANVMSEAVEYDLETDGTDYILHVIADESWINEPDREFPVAIDPTLLAYSFYYTDNNLYVTYVVEGAPNTRMSSGRYHYIGYSTGTQSSGAMTKECRMYAHLADFPDVPPGCTLVDASLQLYNVHKDKGGYSHIGCSRLQICAYPVTGEPSSGSYVDWIQNMTWNSQASYDSNSMLDYAIASTGTCSSYIQWDITEEVERWYEENEDNRTIALVAYETDIFSTEHCASVAFQGYVNYNPPMMVLHYRSAIGIESYYSYQTHSIGYAGNAYVGDYSGQLVLCNTQAVNASTLMPFSLNLVYNSYYAERTIPELKDTGMNFGAGWKLDIVQRLEDDPDSEDYMRHIDADGTYHYYKKDGDIWKDEDGLNLEIHADEEITGSTGSKLAEGYAIVSDKGAKLLFYNGLLVQQTDQNGNAICYLYNGAETAEGTDWLPTKNKPNQITQIVQRNVGESKDLLLASLEYDGDGYLETITDRAKNTVGYNYDDQKKYLTVLDYSSGHTVEYDYQGDGKLYTATDLTGKYQMNYTYGADGRVAGYSEAAMKDDAWENGLAVAVSGTKEKTTYTACGADGVLDTDDDILTTYLFDDAGRTCNVYSTNVNGSQIYGASVGTYTATNDTSGKNNHIASSATVGASASNWLRNAGFETEKTSGSNDANYWSFTGAKTSDTSPTNIISSSDNHRTGSRGLKMWITSNSTKSVSASQTVTGLEIGETYTFSAYINTANAVSFNALGVYLSAHNGTETVQGTPINYKTSTEIENGWTRIDVTFTAGNTNTVSIVSNGVSGITYADDAQLERGDAPSNVNLLRDSGMEYGGAWSGSNYGSTSTHVISGSKAAKVTSTPLTNGYLVQTVPINYSGSNTFVLSAWAKADALADNLDEDLFGERKNFGLKAIVNYTDGTEDTQEYYAPFNAEIRNEWQYGSLIIVPTEPTKTIESIEVYCQYKYNNGSAYFDDISLIKEAAQTMKYDDEGNLKSVATPGVEEDTNTYDNGDLTQIVTSGSGTFTYVYDNHNLKSATNGVITQTYGYSSAGNNTSTTLTGKADVNGVVEQMRTSATYQDHQNLLHEVTDAQDGITKYSYLYDSARMYGTPNVTVNPGGTTYVTSYANDGKMQFQYIDGTVSTHYSYTDNNLTQVIRGGYLPGESGADNKKSQIYNLEYNAFDQLISVAVGTTILSENTYDDVGNLTDQAYGNGDWVSYTYDHLNRVKNESWSGGKDVEYSYSSDGYLSKKVDNDTGEELNYTHDSLNRLIGSSQLDANGNVVQRTEHQYDDSNRLSKQSWQFGDKTYSETYVYNEDGTLKQVQNSNPTSYSFEYDSLSRVSAQSNYYFRQNYGYYVNETEDGDYATPLVSKLSFTDTNEHTQFADFELKYEYDALGNITSIDDSRSGITTYTYDEQGQLLKEDRAGEVYAYSYDTYGNIRSRTDPDGTVHEYEYGDTQWLDLLTKYDGHTITYDEIGNPLSYNNSRRWWSFQWDNGRQLTSASCVDGTVYYTYDLNGIRNSKTVGSITYNYITQNGKVVRQTWKDGNTDYVLDIIYDSNGRPYSCYYQGKCYLYVCNLQGDVIRIVSAYNSTTFVEYTYDAWGNVLSIEGSLASTLGYHNPIRYRGYYYDEETGFYYLQSRYYDPSIGRFINADSFASTGQGFLGYNMFSYCNNSPVYHKDPSGSLTIAAWMLSGVVSGLVDFTVELFLGSGELDEACVAFFFGAIKGTFEYWKYGWGSFFSAASLIWDIIDIGGRCRDAGVSLIDSLGVMGLSVIISLLPGIDPQNMDAKQIGAILDSLALSYGVDLFYSLATNAVEAEACNIASNYIDETQSPSTCTTGVLESSPHAGGGGRIGSEFPRLKNYIMEVGGSYDTR